MRVVESEERAWLELRANYTRAGNDGLRIIELTEDLVSGLETRLLETASPLGKQFSNELNEWWARNPDLQLHQYQEVLFLISSFWVRGEELVGQLPTPVNLFLTLIFKEKIDYFKEKADGEGLQ